jgi:hypothetical protein
VGTRTQGHLGASAYGQEHAGPDAPQALSANLNAATVATADETADEAVAALAAPTALPSRKRKLAERSAQVLDRAHERVVGSPEQRRGYAPVRDALQKRRDRSGTTSDRPLLP